MGRSRSRSRSPPRRGRRDSRSRSRSPSRKEASRRRSRSREDGRANDRGQRRSPDRRESRERRDDRPTRRDDRPRDDRPPGGGGRGHDRRPADGPGRGGGGGGRGGGGRGGGRGRGRDDEKSEQESRYEWGKQEDDEGKEVKPALVEKPNFGLSGALAKDSKTGNVYKGVTLKWSEPADAHKPNAGWRLYVFKGGESLRTLHLSRQSAYMVGRLDIADLKVEHPSCSKQHAVLQFRMRESKDAMGMPQHVIKPYIMDLESVNKTKLNGEFIPPARYIELKVGDMLQFGLSTREYVLMHESMAEGKGGS